MRRSLLTAFTLLFFLIARSQSFKKELTYNAWCFDKEFKVLKLSDTLILSAGDVFDCTLSKFLPNKKFGICNSMKPVKGKQCTQECIWDAIGIWYLEKEELHIDLYDLSFTFKTLSSAKDKIKLIVTRIRGVYR